LHTHRRPRRGMALVVLGVVLGLHGSIIKSPIRVRTSTPTLAGVAEDSLLSAADKVYNAAAAFGPEQAKSAEAWLQQALSANAGEVVDAEDLWLAETSSHFQECTLDGGSDNCQELEDALSDLRTTLRSSKTWTGAFGDGEELQPRVAPWGMGTVRGSFASALPSTLRQTYASPLLSAIERVKQRAAAFGPTQVDLADSWMLEAMQGGDAGSVSLFERRELLFDECLLSDDDVLAKDSDACKALEEALDDLLELLVMEDTNAAA